MARKACRADELVKIDQVVVASGFKSRYLIRGSAGRLADTVMPRAVVMMVRILMLTGDAGEAQEIYYAKFRLEEEGWQVQIATTEKRVFHSVVHDFEPGFDTYTEKPGYRVEADLGLDEVMPATFQGLVLPGGRAPEYLRNRPKAVSIVRHFIEAKKPIAANCHGPLLLLAAGDMKGRKMTCYPDLEPDIRAAGAEFSNQEVVVDGPLVTVRGWPDNGPWMKEFVRVVQGNKASS